MGRVSAPARPSLAEGRDRLGHPTFEVTLDGYQATLPACPCERIPCTRAKDHPATGEHNRAHCHALYGRHREHAERLVENIEKGKTLRLPGDVKRSPYHIRHSYVECAWPDPDAAYAANKDGWDAWHAESNAAIASLKP